MEKIGILTHCVARNYGANLQSLSTACYLRNHGYIPYFLNWSTYLDAGDVNIGKRQVELHKTFLQRNGFNVSEPCLKDSDFQQILNREGIDKIIVGSDAVLTVKSFVDSIDITRRGLIWGNIPADYKFPNPFWLDFLEGRGGVSSFLMSPSCQSSNYWLLSVKKRNKMSKQLHMFKYFSARDSYTQKMICDIAKLNKCDVPITPDPVWNFNDNVGGIIPTKEKLTNKYPIANKPYFVVSFYGFCMPKEKWLKDFHTETLRRGYELVFLTMPQDDGICFNAFDAVPLPLDPLDWYSLIRYSSGYIGNNMHPIICAIHNHLPFVSIDQHGKWLLHRRIQLSSSSKVFDLLSRYGLEKNRIKQTQLCNYSPEDILNILESTDKCKVSSMSQDLKNQYEIMMRQILSLF